MYSSENHTELMLTKYSVRETGEATFPWQDKAISKSGRPTGHSNMRHLCGIDTKQDTPVDKRP